MALQNVITGNLAILKINGQAIGAGIVNDSSFQDDMGLQDIDGLGDAESVELVVGKVTHTISLSKFVVSNKKLDDLGYVPMAGNDYLTSGALEIVILDKNGSGVLEHYTGCKAASHGRTYGKHVPVTESLSVRATTKVPR